MKMCQHVTWNFSAISYSHDKMVPCTILQPVIYTIMIRAVFSSFDKSQARPSSSSDWRGEGRFTELVIPSWINHTVKTTNSLSTIRSNVVFTTPRLLTLTFLVIFTTVSGAVDAHLRPPRHYIISQRLQDAFTTPRSLCNQLLQLTVNSKSNLNDRL